MLSSSAGVGEGAMRGLLSALIAWCCRIYQLAIRRLEGVRVSEALVPRWARVETSRTRRVGRNAQALLISSIPIVKDNSSVPLRVLARLWWVMLQRRWSHESSVGFAALFFVAFLVLLGRASIPPGPAGITLAIGLVLGNAILICLSVGGLSLSVTERLRLLPLNSRVAFRARLIFGSPLRVPLFGLSLGWALVKLGSLHLTPARFATESVKATLLVVAAMLLSALLEEPGGTLALRLVRPAVVAVSGAGTLLVAAGWWALIPPVPAPFAMFAAAARGFLLGGNAASQGEVLAVATYAFAAAILLRAGERYERTLELNQRSPGGSLLLSHLSAPLPVRLRKELFALLRTRRVRREIVASICLALLAFAVGVPWLLIGVPLVWLGFLANALGVDLPLDGVSRYHLAGYGEARALVWRHAAILTLVSGCEALAALTIWAAHGIAVPIVGMPSRWQYGGMGAYVAAILMLTASVMGMIARRYLFPLPRRAPIFSPQPTGPAILIVWLLLAVGFVICAAGIAFAAGSILGRAAGQVVTSADNPAVALSFAAALLALLFAALTRRALLDHD